ncbi:DUF4179 domain-containing protein [Feifania hominis]|uniref:DUF4179 domain-containing protein n=1 Tax=Feifania hominis TaxID=2763660 RepID=A0A926DDR9_9FIRM|nr:DUF4179 domain-containing protein [Feifania hominis]MBC8536233.1 DUF4179 domain-containing protein [Feifania hominis]
MKLTDMMDHLDARLLADIEIDVRESIDTAAVQRLVTRRITARPARRRGFRALLIAAAIVLVMGVTVAATDGAILRHFFGGRLGGLSGEVQPVGESVSAAGVTMTLEAAVNDGSGTLLLFTLRNDDGTPFDENTTVGRARITGAADSYVSTTHTELSQDRRTLYCYLSCSAAGDQTLPDREILFTVDGLVKETRGTQRAEVDLGELYRRTQGRGLVGSVFSLPYGEEPYRVFGAPPADLAVVDPVPEYRLDAVGFIGNELVIVSSLRTREYGGSTVDSVRLTDRVSGGEIASTGATRTSRTDMELLLSVENFALSRGELDRLSELEMELSYTQREVVKSQSWSVSFRPVAGENNVELKPDRAFADSQTSGVIERVTLSPLGVYVDGTFEGELDCWMQDEAFGYFDDMGDFVPFTQFAYSGPQEGTFSLRCTLAGEYGMEPIDVSSVRALRLFGQVLEMPS